MNKKERVIDLLTDAKELTAIFISLRKTARQNLKKLTIFTNQ